LSLTFYVYFITNSMTNKLKTIFLIIIRSNGFIIEYYEDFLSKMSILIMTHLFKMILP